jgi:hypothetical protein
MRTRGTAVLLLMALAGCDSQPADERIEMSLLQIVALCSQVAGKAVAESSIPGNSVTEPLERIYKGTAAQCELEYRIKQQEATKIF